MCWIGVFTKKTNLTKDKFKNAWDKNSDGGGYMYSKDRQLFVEKGFFTFDDFWSSYEKIDVELPRVVHFRLKSAGDVTSINCHPFLVNDGLGFVHNGTITNIKDHLNDLDKPFSDTYLFNERILKPLVKKSCTLIHNHADIQWLISRSIDTDKLAFLNKFGKVVIINSAKGFWEDEKSMWFSSRAHEYPVYNYNNNHSNNNAGNYYAGIHNTRPNLTDVKGLPKYDEWLKTVYQRYVDIFENVA